MRTEQQKYNTYKFLTLASVHMHDRVEDGVVSQLTTIAQTACAEGPTISPKHHQLTEQGIWQLGMGTLILFDPANTAAILTKDGGCSYRKAAA